MAGFSLLGAPPVAPGSGTFSNRPLARDGRLHHDSSGACATPACNNTIRQTVFAQLALPTSLQMEVPLRWLSGLAGHADSRTTKLYNRSSCSSKTWNGFATKLRPWSRLVIYWCPVRRTLRMTSWARAKGTEIS